MSKLYKLLVFLMLIIFCLILVFQTFSYNKKIDSDISKIPLDIEFDRFDLKFSSVSKKKFKNLKKKYNYLFPSQFSDSLWINRKNDTIQIMLQSEVNKVFPDLSKLEKEVELIYKHIIYHLLIHWC